MSVKTFQKTGSDNLIMVDSEMVIFLQIMRFWLMLKFAMSNTKRYVYHNCCKNKICSYNLMNLRIDNDVYFITWQLHRGIIVLSVSSQISVRLVTAVTVLLKSRF